VSSLFKLAASSRLSSVSFRRRSCGTQSSQLEYGRSVEVLRGAMVDLLRISLTGDGIKLGK
jgi:hypothetical protein